MASSYSPNLNLELQATGEDTGAWGQNLNNNVFSVIDAVLGNTLSLPLSGSDVTLTMSQTQNNFIHLTGILTNDLSVIFPQIGRSFFVKNDTTGSHTVTLKTSASGSPVTATVAQGGSSFIVLDGTNVYTSGIGYTPLNSAGGTMTGPLVVDAPNANPSVQINSGTNNQYRIKVGSTAGFWQETTGGMRISAASSDGSVQSYITTAEGGGSSLNGNLAVSGTIQSQGDITYSSDLFWKANIRKVSGCLDRVRRMVPVLYHHKPSGSEKLGLIAQEMERINPLYVRRDKDGLLSLDVASILADLAGAIGELA